MSVIHGERIHDERAQEISKRLREALAKAADEVFEDEAIGAKYVTITEDGYRIGFKEGMGYEISFREVYRPEDASSIEADPMAAQRRGL